MTAPDPAVWLRAAGSIIGNAPVETIAALKARVDIVNIIGRYATLKKRGPDWLACCPLHADGTPSFKVNPARQQFHCFGCGAKGDVVDFLEQVGRLDKAQALQRLRELAGGSNADPAAVTAQAARRAAIAAQEAQDAAQRTAFARRIWGGAECLTRQSAPLATAYLVERRRIQQWGSHSLRWHPACPWETGTAGCIVAPVENAAGDMTGIWRIRPVMEGKVERKGLGPIKGCFAPVVDHTGLDVLMIAEGIEDALAAWVLTTCPAWAALSAVNMAALNLPARFKQIIVCADAEPIGIEAARTLARRLRAEGREARVIVPKTGKDANDVLRARAA